MRYNSRKKSSGKAVDHNLVVIVPLSCQREDAGRAVEFDEASGDEDALEGSEKPGEAAGPMDENVSAAIETRPSL